MTRRLPLSSTRTFRTLTPRAWIALCATCVLAVVASPAFAEDPPEIRAGTATSTGDEAWAEEYAAPVTWAVRGGYLHQFDTDVDGGGSFEVNRATVQVSSTWRVNPELAVSGRFGYSFDGFGFSGTTGLAGMNPWSDIHGLRFGAGVRWQPDDKWTVYGGPTFRFNAERGASLGDGFQFGGFAGFSYKVSDTLTIGPGVGAITQIEDSLSVFPILIINWEIVEDLYLRTGSGLAATQGPGLELMWKFAEHWSLSVGGRYERQRFRLDGNGTAPNGVGQDRGLPVYAAVSYHFNEKTSVSVIGGAHFAGELKLDNDRGNTVAKQEYDPAPFIGVLGSIEF